MDVSGIIRCATVVAACAALAGCGAAPSGDRDIDTVTFVSLNPCLDAILVEVAEPDQILALSHYSRDAGSTSIAADVAAQYEVTGGTAEEVLALDPDFVLASTFIAPSTRFAFERLGVRVETFGSPATMEESAEQVRGIAQLAGREGAGEALIKRMAGPAEPSQSGLSALLWQPGQIVPGKTTLVAEHLRWAGLENYAAQKGLSQADYVSLENVLADPPDILLVAGDNPGQTHPLLQSQRGMLVADFETNLLFCGGPTIPQARARLLEIRKKFERQFKRAAS